MDYKTCTAEKFRPEHQVSMYSSNSIRTASSTTPTRCAVLLAVLISVVCSWNTYLFGTTKNQELSDIDVDAESNFEHLSLFEQELINEALSNSGVELDSTCESQVNSTGRLAAFLVKHDVEDSSDKFQPINYRYPYPFSEEQGVAKTIPIDLKTVSMESKAIDGQITYTAHPSDLLYEGMSEEDILLDLEDIHVEFTIDLDSRLLKSMELSLVKPTKVYFGITIQELRMDYSFEYVAEVGSNVVTSLSHQMKGRLWLVFNPWFKITERYSYSQCLDQLN